MKKVYLIHGWGGKGNQGAWFGWLKKVLKEKEIKVIAFNMPETDKPTIKNWVGFLKKNVKDLNAETFFVGHSIGVQTVLRFLEILPKHTKVGGCAFVAGWFNLINSGEETEEDKVLAQPWLKTPINFDEVKKHCKNFLAIFSNNDWYVPLTDSELFEKNLRARVIIKQNKGHFENEERIQEIVDFILKN